MSPKLEDIARETGFSIATISRVINNSDYPVKQSVRQIILQKSQEMGYKPNLSARSLRTDKTNTIGILVDDLLSPFTPPVVRGVQDFLKEFDFLSLIVNCDWDPAQERNAIDTLISRPVDGLIFVEYSHLTTNENLENSKKPHVFVHRLFGTKINNSVVPDDFYGAGLAVDHLISLGHNAIAYINGPETWHNARERLAGYKDALIRHSIQPNPEWVQPGDWELEGGYRAMENLLKSHNRPTAIFAANDMMALGAIYACQNAGLNVPKDIAIVGYDNREFTSITHPRISTVVMPVYEMGKMAGEMLLKQINEGRREDDEVQIRGRLIIRDTCGADDSMKTREDIYHQTSPRRVLLHENPED